MQRETDQLNSVPILDVARELGIKVKQRKAICFAGHDTKPSLSLQTHENYWKCFGCGRGGKNIQLVMGYENVDFPSAVRWLRERFCMPGGTARRPPIEVERLPKSSPLGRGLTEKAFHQDSEVYEWIVAQSGLSDTSRKYLHGRGFTDETIEHFRIRDLEKPGEFWEALVTKWGYDRLWRCGLCALPLSLIHRSTQPPRLWDHSLWLPFVTSGRVVYLQRRRFCGEANKYVNLAHLRLPIFNVDAVSHLSPSATVYVCEGVPDAMMAHQVGLNAVGLLGANAIPGELVDVLVPFNIVVFPDNDAAGQSFFRQLSIMFLAKGKIIQRAYLPGAKDFNEYVTRVRANG